jgi:hypothetical protein
MNADEQRAQIVKYHEQQLLEAFKGWFTGSDSIKAQHRKLLRFVPKMSLNSLRRSVVRRRAAGINAAVTACLEKVDLLAQRVDELQRQIPSVIGGSFSISEALQEAWGVWVGKFEDLVSGRAFDDVQVNFDADSDPQLKAWHDKFPLHLDESLHVVNARCATLSEALQRYGGLGVEFRGRVGSTQEDFLAAASANLADFLSASGSGPDADTDVGASARGFEFMNVGQGFHRIVMCFLVRCAAIVLTRADSTTMSTASGSQAYAWHEAADTGVRHTVMKVFCELWQRALAYLRRVLRHFLTRVVDAALLMCRMSAQVPVPILFQHRRPFAMFRSNLLRGTHAFVDDHIRILQRELHLGTLDPEHLLVSAQQKVAALQGMLKLNHESEVQPGNLNSFTSAGGSQQTNRQAAGSNTGTSAATGRSGSKQSSRQDTGFGTAVLEHAVRAVTHEVTGSHTQAGYEAVQAIQHAANGIAANSMSGANESTSRTLLGMLLKLKRPYYHDQHLLDDSSKQQWAQTLFNAMHAHMVTHVHDLLLRRMYNLLRLTNTEDTFRGHLEHYAKEMVVEMPYHNTVSKYVMTDISRQPVAAHLALVAPLPSDKLVDVQKQLFGWDSLTGKYNAVLDALRAIQDVLHGTTELETNSNIAGSMPVSKSVSVSEMMSLPLWYQSRYC